MSEGSASASLRGIMKPSQSVPILAALAALTTTASAAIIQFDISPASFGDNTTGLSGPNEAPTNASPATGNEFGAGISLDDATQSLTLIFAYGSAFGFVDLTGNFSDSHVHKGADNVAGGVQFGINGLHTPSGTKSGSYSGTVGLSAGQQADLLAGLLYINIHSSTFGGGEIRGQLVQVVPEPASAVLLLSGAVAVLGLRRRRTAN